MSQIIIYILKTICTKYPVSTLSPSPEWACPHPTDPPRWACPHPTDPPQSGRVHTLRTLPKWACPHPTDPPSGRVHTLRTPQVGVSTLPHLQNVRVHIVTLPRV
ncbi:unnamed protein product, partial [Staurois parvus]